MAHVFLADETALGRRVVVKVLAPELAHGLSAERFAREVRFAASLQHPNILPVFTAGDADGAPYYTMPFVQGESLRARLAREGALTTGEAIAILRDVARATRKLVLPASMVSGAWNVWSAEESVTTFGAKVARFCRRTSSSVVQAGRTATKATQRAPRVSLLWHPPSLKYRPQTAIAV